MKWPSKAFASGLGVIEALVDPVSITANPSVMPITANIVPMVMISEGMSVRTTRRPLTIPTSRPTASAAAMPTRSGIP